MALCNLTSNFKSRLQWRYLEYFRGQEKALLCHSNHGRKVYDKRCIIFHELIIVDETVPKDRNDCKYYEGVRDSLDYGTFMLKQVMLQSFNGYKDASFFSHKFEHV